MGDRNYAGKSGSQFAKRRLAGLGLALLLALVLVAWIKSNISSRVAELERAFTTIRSESFLVGLQMREALVRLNSVLLRFQLSGDEAERERFEHLGREFESRLSQGERHALSAEEQALLAGIAQGYQQYQSDAREFLERSLRGVRRDSVVKVQEQIHAISKQLLSLLDDLVAAQQSSLGSFFSGTTASLASLQSLLWGSIGLLFLLVGLATALMFRAFIAPLRVQLSASQAVVERQEKLASLGVLAAGVAHEIRNPLTAIKFRLFSLKKALPPELEDNEDVGIIHSEVNRLERIVKDFLQFARPSEPELVTMEVEELLRGSQLLLQEELGKRGIQLQIEGNPAGAIRADRQQMRQVLINLVQNAAESIGQNGGAITLRAREGAARLKQGSEPVVFLEVADTGSGIQPGAEQRIFDPFFSTKENGSGLGLPIAARIVEKHGGSIHYVTQPNRGTTFSIVLPRVPSHESANPPH